jgi:hypothetical protein
VYTTVTATPEMVEIVVTGQREVEVSYTIVATLVVPPGIVLVNSTVAGTTVSTMEVVVYVTVTSAPLMVVVSVTGHVVVYVDVTAVSTDVVAAGPVTVA